MGSIHQRYWSRGRRLIGDGRLMILVVFVILVFTTRVLPFTISNLPFNNDGISDSRIASDILESGHLEYPEGSFYVASHTVSTPAYNILLALAASALGVTPYAVAQVVVAIFGVLTIVGFYLISLRLTKDVSSSMAAVMVLSLLGTFVYLTGSTWKESLGMAFFALVVYAYMNRSRISMLALEITALAVLPIVHHYVTILVYLGIAALTFWSVTHALLNRGVQRRHIVDSAVVIAMGIVAYLYYRSESLDRLTYVVGEGRFTILILSFMVTSAAMMVFLMRRNHSRYSFAPLPAITILALFVYDYFRPIFPYSQGSPVYVLILGVAIAILIAVAWFGFEMILETDSRYRAIPLGLLIPVLTLLLFASLSGLDRTGHQILYRTFDFADPALAVGVACALSLMKRRSLRTLTVVVLLIALVVSFPFGYATNALTGVRHDTQDYEVDAVVWIYSVSAFEYSLHSDERMSYNARAYFDYSKCPYLPSKLANREVLSPNPWYVLLEEWTTIGVNDYPNGHPILDAEYVAEVLSGSDVYYVGGPADNNIIVFSSTSLAGTG